MMNGTVPILPHDYLLQKLTPNQMALMELAVARALPPGPDVAADVEEALDALDLTGVWGRSADGYTYVRAFLFDEEHMYAHTSHYGWDDPSVPADIRKRVFHWAPTPDDLFVRVMATCKAIEKSTGARVEVTPEDHPGMGGIGFRLAQANEVYLIKQVDCLAALESNTSIHPDALKLMRTASGRRMLGKILSAGKMTNVLTGAPTLLSQSQGVTKELRRADERVRVGRSAQVIADAFMRRNGRAGC